MDIHGYSAHILVNGRKVKEYRHNGLTFIEAKNGTEFAIEVKNHQSNRVLAIVSVDGIDVIDGKPANNKSRGYIVSGSDAQTFHGWRKSDTEVANFQFTPSGNSYATEKGKGQNNGVIAVKLIAEKIVHIMAQEVPWKFPDSSSSPSFPSSPTFPFHPRPYWNGISGAKGITYGGSVLRSSEPVAQAMFCSTSLSSDVEEKASFDMGTTWGSKREDRVKTTEFIYGNELGTFEFYYASREALKAMGVPLINERQIPSLPKAFEGSTYAQPPKNWRG